MGKPVISITPINFYVEKYLIKVGLIKKIRNPVTLTKYIKSILSKDALIKNKDNTLNNNKKLFNQRTVMETSLKIQSEMEDPIEIFKKFLFNP
jgi:predicted glycosyltransferase